MNYLKISLFSCILLSLTFMFACSTEEFEDTLNAKQEYTSAEKNEISALAKKYNIELTPVENKTNAPLLSIEELEEKFRNAVNAKSALGENMNTKTISQSTRKIKTRSELNGGSKTISYVQIEDGIFYAFADVTVHWNHYRVTNVDFKVVNTNSSEELRYTHKNLRSMGPIEGCSFFFDITRSGLTGYTASGTGYISENGCELYVYTNYSIPGYRFYVKKDL